MGTTTKDTQLDVHPIEKAVKLRDQAIMEQSRTGQQIMAPAAEHAAMNTAQRSPQGPRHMRPITFWSRLKSLITLR